MEIIRGSDRIGKPFNRPFVAVGNFDGAHVGHQTLITKMVRRVQETEGESVVYTFDPHPLQVLNPSRLEGILTSFSEKMGVFEELGVDFVICEEFNLEFSKNDALTFIQEYLHLRLGAKEIFVGKGFAFGKGRGGSTEDLKRIGGDLGIQVHIEPPVTLGGGVVSSSRIRSLLKRGSVAQASLLLGRPYVLEGEVVMGAQRGRELGFSTANLLPDEKVVPKRGVYAVKGEWGGKVYEGVAYIGSQPTFNNNEMKIEVHLFQFKKDLYKDRIKVFFVDRIRDEMKFEGPQALVKQIQVDIQRAQEVFKEGGQGVLTVK